MVDLFISYAHIDNHPLPPDEIGWISRFHKSLQTFINTRLGEKVEIWRDEKLRGNDIFGEEITDQFKNTKILISILSPRYVQSEWCNREVRGFCEAAENDSGLVVDNKSRVLKIIKIPVKSEDALPKVIQDQLGYSFYELKDGETPLELDPSFGPEFAQAYNRKMGVLAWDISQLLQSLDTAEPEDGPSGAGAARQAADGLKIFVCECSYDRDEDREKIMAELKAHGHTVLPDCALPKVEAKVIDELQTLLEQADISIHLIGSSYGSVPDGPSRKSIVELQNDVAVLHAKTGDLERLIWVPNNLTPTQPAQKDFIEALNRNADLQYGADLIAGDLEHLKDGVHALIEKVKRARSATDEEESSVPTGQKLVYLICDERDRRATVPVRKLLKKKGIAVEIPLFAGSASQMRQVNRDLMTNCDAVLLFYGEGDEAWKRIIDSDVRKAAGYRTGKKKVESFVYLSAPDSSHKQEMVDFEEDHVIDGRSGFSQELLQPLLAALVSAGEDR